MICKKKQGNHLLYLVDYLLLVLHIAKSELWKNFAKDAKILRLSQK